MMKYRPEVEAAKAALEGVLQGERGKGLVKAVYTKFLIITDAEMDDWLVGPDVNDSLPPQSSAYLSHQRKIPQPYSSIVSHPIRQHPNIGKAECGGSP